jgi:hypothetical protein
VADLALRVRGLRLGRVVCRVPLRPLPRRGDGTILELDGSQNCLVQIVVRNSGG